MQSVYYFIHFVLYVNVTFWNIPEGDVNVQDKMNEIINTLHKNKGKITFFDLFKTVSRRREALAMFLALLELIRLQKVRAYQNTPWGNIHLEMW